jgi:hypothetical protein
MVSLKSLAILALGALPAMAAPASNHVANRVAARQKVIEVLACEHKDWTPTCFVLRDYAGVCCKSKTDYLLYLRDATLRVTITQMLTSDIHS